ncbi:MAG: 3D domain-containing protein [Lachnospiraceae bacterium]|nr:3D domain-containing protein [Lachnospiraceae bacterium]
MKFNFKEIEFTKVKKDVKSFFQNNYKMVGSAAVITALCAVCTVNLVANIADSNAATGVMVTISDVAEDEVPYAGEKIEVASMSYYEMKSANYEAEQLANLEKSEKQIDDVLSSKAQEDKDVAALDALTAQNTTATTTEEVTVPTANEEAPVVATYADANGTYVSIGDYVLTAYCPCPICCGVYSNMTNPTTASGTTATAGRTIAADTSILPFGTQVVINGQVYTVEDTGGAIKGNRIDIFFNSHQAALEFGRRVATVYVAQ